MKFVWMTIALAALTAGIAGVATPYRQAPARQTPLAATEGSGLPVALPKRQLPGKAKADPFAPRDWAPRAPPAPVRVAHEQEPAPAPSVPTNPYRFAGTLHYGGSLKAVFIREERVHLALPGEMLDGGYKVLSVTRAAVTLLYTPLDLEQQIALAWDPAPDTAIAQAPGALQLR
jgi:hypothetical protein